MGGGGGGGIFSNPVEKSVLIVLKTWYFPYSACQLGGGAAGYATDSLW